MTYVNVNEANSDIEAFECSPDKRYKITGIQIYNGGTSVAVVTIKDVITVGGNNVEKIKFVGAVSAGGNLVLSELNKTVSGTVYVNSTAPVQVVIDKEVV